MIKSTILVGQTAYLFTSRKAIIVLLKFLTTPFQRITLKQKTVASLTKL